MKSSLTFLTICLFAVSFAMADGGKYKITDEQVDAYFVNAEEITPSSDFEMFASPNGEVAEKNPWVAWGLTFTASIGICGIHRLYLGTETMVFVAYLCTAGGCGIVQTIDWVVLLIGAINEDIGKYIDNPKLFMF